MCDPATIALGSMIMTGVSAGVSYMSSQKQAGEQKAAMAQEQKNADTAATAAEQANNKANAVMPNTAAIEATNNLAAQGGKGGGGGTMLTSPTGVDPTSLNLGKNTLLGSN